MNTADLIIIGGGPGGYEIAAEAARSGLKVMLAERAELGGTCLNRGCIPTKCLCASASTVLAVKHAADFGVEAGAPVLHYDRAAARTAQVVDQLRQGIESMLRGVEVVRGEARLAAGGTVSVAGDTWQAPRVIIATGSRPALLPIPGAELAVTSDEMLRITELPASVCIIGGGVIGMEFASVLAAFGVEVTVVEYCKEILPPFDKDVAKRLRMSLSRRGGIKIVTEAAVSEIRRTDDPDRPLEVVYAGKKGPESVPCHTAVMAVGRRPVVPEGCAEAGVEITGRGFIKVDAAMRTTAPGIFAVGDVNGICMLAHAASAQARVALGADVNLELIPSAVFTIPECAMAGLTEEQCLQRGLEFAVSKAMFAACGKAVAMGEAEGFVKVVFEKTSHRLLGVHVIGPHAADIVAEAAAFLSTGATLADVNATVHAHPTLSEVFAAACAAAHPPIIR